MRASLSLPVCVSVVAACGTLTTEREDAQSKSTEPVALGMRIGRGIDVNGAEPLRGDCIQDAESKVIRAWKSAQGIKAKLTDTRVTSHEELLKEVSMSISAAARYKFVKADASYSRYDKFAASEDAFTWLFSIRAISGEDTLALDQITKNSLTSAARAYLDKGDFEGFKKMCGSHYIRSVKYGGHIVNVQEISSKAQEQVRKIHSSVSAGGGGVFSSASVKATFDSVMQEAAKRSMYKRELSQEGGKKIAHHLTPENLNDVLREYELSLTQENSVPLEVEVVDWSTALNLAPNPLELLRQQKIARLYKMFWSNSAKIDKIDAVLYLFENNKIDLSAETVSYLERKQKEILDQQDVITENGAVCFEEPSNCSDSITQIAVDFPKYELSTDLGLRDYAFGSWTLKAPFALNLHQNPTVGLPGVSAWFADPILLEIGQGAHAPVTVEITLKEQCKNAVAELRNRSTTVLTNGRGEKVPYIVLNARTPSGAYMNEIQFGLQREGGQCLLLSFVNRQPIPVPFSMDDNSQLSRVANQMASSLVY